MPKTYFRYIILQLLYSGIHSLIAQDIQFQDVTSELSIESVPDALEFYGHGISACDYDKDGDIDFYLAATVDVPNRLYQNKGDGSFVDVAAGAGIDISGQTKASLWVDVVNNGLPDLLVFGDCYETEEINCTFARLYVQNSDHTFLDLTESSQIAFPPDLGSTFGVSIGGVAAGDLNNDGFLDIVASLWNGYFAIYFNNGNGTFQVETLGDIKYRWQPMIHDFDGDGWQDIYMNVDIAPNEFWRNQGDGTFEDLATQLGVDNNMSDMGMSLSDFDNDGDIDIYITNIAGRNDHDRNVLFENTTTTHTGLSFVEIAEDKGISYNGWDWGLSFSDFNNDGWLDLAATNGHVVGSGFEHDRSGLWQGDSSLNFTQITNEGGFNDTLNAATLIAVDINRDGDLDLLQSIKKTLGVETTTPVRIYENQLDQSNNYLVIKPRQESNNRFAIGAVVRVKTSEGTQSKLISAGCSFYGQEPAEAHFGLGSATEVEEVTIVWPGGRESSHFDVNVNQVITIDRPMSIPSPTNFQMVRDNEQVQLSWDGLDDYDVILERVIVGLSTQYLNLGQQAQFTDFVDLESTSFKYRIRFANDSGKSAWSEYQTAEYEEVVMNFEVGFEMDTTKYSIARLWNELLLESIRNDYARPTVHARNLFHISSAMYDAWSVLAEGDYIQYLLGQTKEGFSSNFTTFHYAPEIRRRLRQQAISYAAYRMIEHRFANSPGVEEIMWLADSLMNYLGFDPNFTSTDYSFGSSAALGNFIAYEYIRYGLNDRSNEADDYANQYYEPINPYLDPEVDGNPSLIDPNRWQPLAFNVFVDQSGNEIPGDVPPFLGAEWGWVKPFSLTAENKTVYSRDGHEYPVYFDPGPPPYMTEDGSGTSDQYRHGFSMVAVWSGHLDTSLDQAIDISPGSLGNFDLSTASLNPEDFDQFYSFTNGGDPSTGHSINPATNQPYEPQMVKLGDYGRILAEFWADGPDSETPPGHWFTILNKVNDDEHLVRKFGGEGDVLDKLEWDVKSYFILGGTMHDVAITAWGIKGYYDYVRPICAIRFIADKGQASDPMLPSYHPQGIELVDGYIELVGEGDPLAGAANENVGKIKLFAWKGHDYIEDIESDVAGVDWILAEDWWPYQRPTFVTPNFAGYVSGHSTYSRAAAEVLTRITGDPFFPGGMGEFEAKQNEFLVFEEGPSMDITLQWATYRDASDQCSLSRIWGGIHPPADDLPARVIGEQVGNQAFEFGVSHFAEVILGTQFYEKREVLVYPIPAGDVVNVEIQGLANQQVHYTIYDLIGRVMISTSEWEGSFQIPINNLDAGRYILHIRSGEINTYKHIVKR